jgi:uncharacterized protein
MEPFTGDAYDLHDFEKVCRLFPLPEVVLFPHAVLPLHIFEPRYRQMTEDALSSGDKLVTIVQLCPPGTSNGLGHPAIEEVACLGKILRHQRLPDGRFNFLLQGLKRVRLIREIPGDRLYRRAEAEILEDQDPDEPDDRHRTELLALFRQAVQHGHRLDPELESLLETVLPLGVLTDLIAQALSIPATVKQGLLGETRVALRADCLREILGERLARVDRATDRSRGFPPPFSVN